MAVRSAKKSEFPGMEGSNWGRVSLARHEGIIQFCGLKAGEKVTRAARKLFRGSQLAKQLH
jgi:hypothetical protein